MKKERTELIRMLGLIGQLGLSMVSPPLILVWLAHRLSLGPIGMLAAIVCGLISSFCGALRIYRREQRRAEKEKNNTPTAFNRHE